MRHPLTLGSAGHIDHGKTELVRALTGRSTDRLPEERERGISIELGYARLELPGGHRLSVVDVPGHERFVRTMVAGASGIDLFLLCVAADDGVMPQTREHVAVLRALGIERGVVAVTKADLADPVRASAEVAELVPGAERVAVCAPRGEGVAELLAVLERTAAQVPSRALEGGPCRLHVDRSFTLRGIGTVVTGTLWSGSVAAGERVRLLPAGRDVRIRSVQVHDEAVERASAGQRVALNLSGIGWREVERGDVLCDPDSGLVPTWRVDAAVRLEPSTRPLRRGARVQVHHGTREAPARVVRLDGEELRQGEPALAQLRLEAPLVPARGDRLVLRQVAPPDTIGGGEVIDPRPRRHGGGEDVLERLRAMRAGAPVAAVAAERAAGGSALAPRAGESKEAPGERTAAPSPPPPPLDAAALRLADLVRAGGSTPPANGDLAAAAGLDRGAAGERLAALVRAGRAVRVARNLHYDPEALAGLTAQIVAICERDGRATIAGVRDELGLSRRYAQALLEHLDGEKVTIRRGDEHVLRLR
jgi:selenocysteine-specific elongation factor